MGWYLAIGCALSTFFAWFNWQQAKRGDSRAQRSLDEMGIELLMAHVLVIVLWPPVLVYFVKTVVRVARGESGEGRR